MMSTDTTLLLKSQEIGYSIFFFILYPVCDGWCTLCEITQDMKLVVDLEKTSRHQNGKGITLKNHIKALQNVSCVGPVSVQASVNPC